MEKAKTKMAVCAYYQLGRFEGNKFSKEHKTLIKENFPVERSYMEEINSQWLQCGKLFIEDEQASIDFEQKVKEKMKVRKEADELHKKAGRALLGVVKDAVSAPAPVEEADEDSNGKKNRK